jgi:hypothetical protein
MDGDPGCDPKSTVSGESQGLAALANVSGHELSEARTDPTSDGWYDSAGQENGDKCAWTFNIPSVTRVAEHSRRTLVALLPDDDFAHQALWPGSAARNKFRVPLSRADQSEIGPAWSVAQNGKGPSPFESGPASHIVVKLFLDLRLPRPCRRPIAFTETLAASAIPPLDETRSQVIAPAIAANQFV